MPKPNFYGETQILDSATRATLPGRFVNLSLGVTHYELAGPADGQMVVLVHGFGAAYPIWDRTFGALAEAGFRVLRYDLYGRGFSDRPDMNNDLDLFDCQLTDLLAAVSNGRPVDLVGLSMGGPIVATFADRHPSQVRKLVLIGPAGYPMRRSIGLFLVRRPLIGELLWRLESPRAMVEGLRKDLANRELPAYADAYREALPYQGFKRSLLSTLRHMPLEKMAPVYERLGRQKRPVLILWGREDPVIPLAQVDRLRAAMPRAEFHAIDGAGHCPHYERREVVNPLLIDFLRRETAAGGGRKDG
jgi:pimeloyl-ACP methyl ester carboxylesterase